MVVVDDAVYVRAYYGEKSRWYRAALSNRAGRIELTGCTREVAFEPVKGSINDRIDDAYRTKYGRSPYLDPMISSNARSATIRVLPRT